MSNSPYFVFRKIYKYRYLVGGILIVLAALVIRFFQLGEIPAGLTWDEAAIGYNGYSVATTGRDEWLELLPISFRSFGDYKAPLAIYANGAFTRFLGLNPFVVRLPFALSGILAVAGIMLLIKQLWRYHPQAKFIALVSGAVLAFSPWHIQFTRAGFESGLALTIIIWATYAFVVALQKKSWLQIGWMSASALLFTASLYTYHSAKLFTPLWVLFLAVKYRRRLWRSAKASIISGALGLAAVAPLVNNALFSGGLERAEVTVFSQADSITGALFLTGKNLLYHLRPQFLILGEIDSFRHGSGSWGVLLHTTAFMVLIGAGWYLWTLLKRKTRYKQIFGLASLSVMWILLGLLPAAIGKLIPHSNRSLLALPGFIGLALVGMIMLKRWLKTTSLNKTWQDSRGGNGNLAIKAFLGLLVSTHILLFAAYFQHYLFEYPAKAVEAYNHGYLEALQLAEQYELGTDGYSKVSQVIVSSQYGQPVIYTLFTKQISPFSYHQGGLINYLYPDQVNTGDLQRDNALVVATQKDEIPLDRAQHKIYGNDGQVRFGLFLTKEFN